MRPAISTAPSRTTMTSRRRSRTRVRRLMVGLRGAGGGRAAELVPAEGLLTVVQILYPARMACRTAQAGEADGVGELHLALAGQAGGDDVLGDVAGHVGGRAVHLGRVLAAKGAAAVPAAASVGVHDDLAPRQAAVAVRAAHQEAARRVDV